MKLLLSLVAFLFVFITTTLASENPKKDICTTLDRAECMDSTQCTLILTKQPNVYSCILSNDSCETGKKQSMLTKKSCENVKNCQYNNANCYCPCAGYGQTLVNDKKAPDCSCDCSGGEPPNCTSIQ